ncbi:MAG: 50S ribosomal protein L21 [Sumerlaeia bacterium]
MYAVIKQGGRQYKVSPGDIIQIDLIEAEKGSEVELTNVYMLHDGENLQIGKPVVEGVAVQANVVRTGKGRKIIVYKYKRRQGYHKKQGHRQDFTEVRVKSISRNGAELTTKATA